ncbi:MAG: hydroxymethylbilane synthase [Syntrophomonadaceae bacterium]|nr:hydroxymethylbilane synthase [Syntrophomonadaceae bacterium]
MRRLRLGTRGSKLALWQAEYAARELQKAASGLVTDIKIIKTAGDKILNVALSKIGDKGLFTKEIEKSLLAGEIDVAVHSMKDIPSSLEKGLRVGAVLKRENPQDVLISPKGYTFADLPENAVIGTSSLRRTAQVKLKRPDIRVVEMRGNVETRIKKMREQNLDGVILAYAGVKRLNFGYMISDFLSCDLIMPAVGQGAIALEIRDDDQQAMALLEKINDEPSYFSTLAERSFLNELEGGCRTPIASLAEVNKGQILLRGMVLSLDGEEVYQASLTGSLDEAESIGRQLARRLLRDGAGRILESIQHR